MAVNIFKDELQHAQLFGNGSLSSNLYNVKYIR